MHQQVGMFETNFQVPMSPPAAQDPEPQPRLHTSLTMPSPSVVVAPDAATPEKIVASPKKMIVSTKNDFWVDGSNFQYTGMTEATSMTSAVQWSCHMYMIYGNESVSP